MIPYINNIYIYIIKYILKKELYIKYSSFIYININKEPKEVQNLYRFLKEMFETFPDKEEITLDEYCVFVLSKDGSEVIKALLQTVSEVVIDDSVADNVLQEAKHRALATELALMCIQVSEGKESYTNVLTKVKEFDIIDVSTEIEYVTDNLEELYDQAVTKPGLRWRLRTLNEMLGSLRKGDFGFLFARPESGKTTFLASEVSFFAEQLGNSNAGTCLWFNNEEQGEKVQLRIYQAALGVTLNELFSDRIGNQKKYNDLVGNRIRIVDRANIHRADVEEICRRVKPALIIFDQIDKVKGFANDREDLRLGAIYIWARELAKEYCPVIGVTQANGTGEGKQWLTMENVSGATTSKQAEADWILGIGKKNDQGYEYVRHLHLSKNKLTGDPDTIPELRHGKRDVIIKPEISRYIDI